MNISDKLLAAVKASPHQRERLAAALSVSASTIDRWSSGAVAPTAKHLSALQAALADHHQPASHENVLRELMRCLGQAREVMHAHGAASSRNDALDQISLLLTAHFHFKQNGGAGLQETSSVDAATRLCEGVESLRMHLPAVAYGQLLKAAMSLAEKPQYLVELIASLKAALDVIDESGDWRRPQDFHEVFVNFLASSFHEEKEFAQYMTPREIVDFMVRIGLSLCSFDENIPTVLDPSCGTGSFLTNFAELYGEDLDLAHEGISCGHLIGVDTSERMIRLTTASFMASNLEPTSIFLDSSLNPVTAEARAVLQDNTVDLILTNPPFGAEHSRGQHGGVRMPSEVLYVEKYVDWLRPGGIALSIVPDSVLTNKGAFAALRSRLVQSVDVLAVVSLPSVTFAASGTTTKTSVLIFRKKTKASDRKCFFAVANNVGFEVSTRGSVRKRTSIAKNDLPEIAKAIISGEDRCDLGVLRDLDEGLERWDAQFINSSLSLTSTSFSTEGLHTISSLASLTKEKATPLTEPGDTFNYIEISNVDGDLLRVSATPTPRMDAPSRARRRVRAGDVLVSTVRPERKTIGVVPPHLDGAICSTGFAVLRPISISPYILAAALRAPESTAQLIGISSGVAYPAFDANALPSVRIGLGSESWQESCVRYGASLEDLELRRMAVFSA